MSSTISSLDIPHTHLHPSTHSHSLHHLIITSLQRKGFDAGEAGAVAEIERLLERHVQYLFSAAVDYANLAHRATPNASDLLSAYDEGSYTIRKLRKEAKKQRRMKIVDERQDTDGELRGMMSASNKRLEYAYDGAPTLPGSWTYAITDPRSQHHDGARKEAPVQVKVTAASLDFVKSTATERGDISPELGLVHYRRGAWNGKRKWGVKGVGVG